MVLALATCSSFPVWVLAHGAARPAMVVVTTLFCRHGTPCLSFRLGFGVQVVIKQWFGLIFNWIHCEPFSLFKKIRK